ncbi:stage II sporulation protein M [Undibacterium cyanobacteriorum]|uniref:Stage II sporulation protein M n=1 Tax=Undibacterium cyanobacteriorum TaxID=3073561 RepID=A0ABY9RIB2_9BURK|nr:stage II sporulation protein M [Undibacterium sp. 20NA77.5]WMW80962.1 stage II sporulation protein M [Undibacterium sp. 20NA77.5]
MKQKQFEAHHEALWTSIQEILNGDKKTQTQRDDFPSLYRRLCQTLALAQQRGYSPALTDHLQILVGRCHQRLYGVKVERSFTLHRWLFQEFPQRVRAEWKLLLLINLSFWGVALGLGCLVWFAPETAYYFLDSSEIEHMRSMYQSASFKEGRGAVGDFGMFGFYVWNNVSIDFRTFAGGIFFGVPALLIMAFNGMQMGIVASVLSADPSTRHNFWSFVITHGSFEIIGMLFAGVAGMRLGLTVIAPGRASRRQALYEASQRVFPILIGAAILTFIAAFFEAFFCASPNISANVKYITGTCCWIGLIAFFVFAGRSKGARHAA